MDARARADIDDVIRGPHGILVMLDDDQGVPQVAHLLQGLDEFVVVALVKADRRFVQDIKDAGKLRADLGRKTNALGLAPRQGHRVTGQSQVIEAHIHEEGRAVADFLEDHVRDRVFGFVQGRGNLADPKQETIEAQFRSLENVEPPDFDGQGGIVKTRAVAGDAYRVAHEGFVILAHERGGSLRVKALDFRLGPLDVVLSAHEIAVYRSQRVIQDVRGTDEGDVLLPFREFRDGLVPRNAVMIAKERVLLPIEVRAPHDVLIIADAALVDAEGGVRDQQIDSDLALDA